MILMRWLACWITVVLFPSVLFSQSLLPGSPALLLVEQAQQSLLRPSLAVNDAGEALLLWGDTAVWTDAIPRILTRSIPSVDVRQIFDVKGETWIGMYRRGYDFGPPTTSQGWYGVYFCGSGVGPVLRDSSRHITSAYHEVSMSEPGSAMEQLISSNSGWMYGQKLILANHESSWSTWAGVNSRAEAVKLWSWVPGQQAIKMYEISDDVRNSTYDSLYTLLRVSRPMGGTSMLYRRQILETTTWLFSQEYQRSFATLDLASGTVHDTVIVDTIHSATLDASDEVLPQRGTHIDVLRRNVVSDRLFAERYAVGGDKQSTIGICGPVRVYHVHDWRLSRSEAMEDQRSTRADYSVLPLQDGRTLLAWSAPAGEDRADIRVALFDEDWKVQGAIKQAHVDGPELRVYPTLTLHDNRVYLAWQMRDGEKARCGCVFFPSISSHPPMVYRQSQEECTSRHGRSP